MSKTKLTIILPVYNEGKNITKVINSIKSNVNIPKEIIVVYDFDNDNTIPPVKVLQKRNKEIKLIKNKFGGGLLNAIKTGFHFTKSNILVVMPADLADDPKVISQMYDEILKGYHVVAATRYSKGGEKHGGEILKSLLSKFAGLSTPIVLGIPITDLSNGFKMYRKEIIDKIKIESDGGWEFASELTIKAHHLGYRISEVPATWNNRVHGKSHFKLKKWLPKYIYWYTWGIKKRFQKDSLKTLKLSPVE